MALIIALNIALVAFVLVTIVGLHARSILLSREEAAIPQPRRARTRTQPARRLATVNG